MRPAVIAELESARLGLNHDQLPLRGPVGADNSGNIRESEHEGADMLVRPNQSGHGCGLGLRRLAC